MCGIVGEINFSNQKAKEANITTMMHSIKHRGPDDEGVFIDDGVGLGFVRLSILDLSKAGHQPMFNDDKSLVIIYNGEIYNYIELREELKQKGFSFRSNSDSEVVLKAYEAWGEECLDKFNGMWAFVIYNIKTKEIFGARDRFGIKPFYYYLDNERFLFASEIKALKKVVPKLTINEETLFNYLVFNRTDYNEDTFYQEIKKLPHSHCFSIKNNKFSLKRWYNLAQNLNKEPIDKSEYLELFSSSIRLRMRSDVPVGVCLSGGLDSSSIASVLVKKLKHSDINTFSAVYQKGQRGDESDFIEQMKPYLKNMHFITPTAKTLFEDLSSMIEALDEPVPTTSIYAQYSVMKLAKEYAVVTLDGQGADEQLAGYHYFYGFYFKELLKNFEVGELLREISYYLQKHKSLFGLKTFAFFLLPKSLRLQARVAKAEYIQDEFFNRHKGANIVAGELYGAKSLKEALINHFEYKLEHLLKWSDLNSMHFSLESRVPFLDYRLVEYTLSLPNNAYIQKGLTKYILRESMKGILPEKIRMRYDKVGFATPEDEWFREKFFQELIFSILEEPIPSFSRYINTQVAIKRYKSHLNKEINCSKDIWKWINLHFWLKALEEEVK